MSGLDLDPPIETVNRLRNFVAKYRQKSGTFAHPNQAVTDGIVNGLAKHVQETGRPLCPCNFYPNKKQELADSRRWVCACDEMKKYKYCHCLLFVNQDGLPITEYLPVDHEGRSAYGLVDDPSPEQGRESSN